MTNFNIGQIMQMAQRGVNPDRLVQQLVKQNPAVKRAAELINGKSDDQIKEMVYSRARQMGVNLDEMARQMGIKLPK